MTILYLSGKYSADTFDGITKNIMEARKIAVNLWEQGFTVQCPQMNTAHFEVDTKKVSYDDWLKGDLEMEMRCDAVIMLPGWKDSKGSKLEHELAEKYQIPIYYWPDHPEITYQELFHVDKLHALMKALMILYRSFLRGEI